MLVVIVHFFPYSRRQSVGNLGDHTNVEEGRVGVRFHEPVNYNLKNLSFLERISATLTLCKDDEFTFKRFYFVH